MIGVLFVRISTFAGRCLTRGAAPDGAPPLRLYIAAGRTRHTLAQLYRPRIDPAQNRVQLADQIEWASKRHIAGLRGCALLMYKAEF
jgi:hypothetical protein